MKLPLIFTSLIAAILFSSCDSSSPTSQNFLANQIAILKTGSLIQAASLSAQIPADILSSSLEITPIKGTDLLSITAHHDDEALPKTIVQALLDAYQNHRNHLGAQAIKPLDEELIKQSDIVQEKRKEMTVWIQSYGIPYFDGDNRSPLGASEQDMFRSARHKLADFQTQRDQIEIQIKELSKMTGDELVEYAAGLDLPENQVTYYFTQHREALEQKRTLLAQGLAANHPDVRAVEERAEGAMDYAKKEAVSLSAVLKTKLELINRQVERIEEMVEDRQEDTPNLSSKQNSYNTAKEAYEQARETLRNLKIQQQETRILLKQPRNLIIIHGWDHQ
jgi:succinoglycan biosynthesis transport protein ExoP